MLPANINSQKLSVLALCAVCLATGLSLLRTGTVFHDATQSGWELDLTRGEIVFLQIQRSPAYYSVGQRHVLSVATSKSYHAVDTMFQCFDTGVGTHFRMAGFALLSTSVASSAACHVNLVAAPTWPLILLPAALLIWKTRLRHFSQPQSNELSIDPKYRTVSVGAS